MPSDERHQRLRAAGVEPNPVRPLSDQWAAPRHWNDGVFKQGAVVLAGDMFLEALNGDALARQEVMARQEKRKQMRLKQLQMEQAMSKVDVQWAAGKGTPGRRLEAQRMCILRRTPELSSEKVGKVPKGAIVHVLEMLKPNEEGIRRALVQDTWGKKSGWLTAVDVDGEASLCPVREELPPRDDDDDGDRGEWLNQQTQHWIAHHFPKYDQIHGQQERSMQKHMQLKQYQKQQRQQTWSGAAGKKSVVEGRAGGAGGAFRAARAMGAR